MKAALRKLIGLARRAACAVAEFASKDSTLAGCAVIVAGVLLTSAANRSAEAYSISMQASCAATVTAAAVIELSGADCRPEGGYPPAIYQMCKITHGRTSQQVAALPQCREATP